MTSRVQTVADFAEVELIVATAVGAEGRVEAIAALITKEIALREAEGSAGLPAELFAVTELLGVEDAITAATFAVLQIELEAVIIAGEATPEIAEGRTGFSIELCAVTHFFAVDFTVTADLFDDVTGGAGSEQQAEERRQGGLPPKTPALLFHASLHHWTVANHGLRL